MTFFPLSLKALAILAIAALAGVAVALTRSKSIDSTMLGSEWQAVLALETARADRHIFAPIRERANTSHTCHRTSALHLQTNWHWGI
jgi:hypothetical protein